MKILKSSQIREVDEFTIRNEPILSIDLMERAAMAISQWISENISKEKIVKIFTGPGNNGGDGLAIARQLIDFNFKVEVYVLKISNNLSKDCNINLDRLKEIKRDLIKNIADRTDFPELNQNNVILDGMFGSGLTRKLDGLAKELVQFANNSKAKIVAIDIPSGLFGENTDTNDMEAIIKAKHTLTFQLPKLSFFYPENQSFVGNWRVLPIGLDEDFINSLDTNFYQTDENYIRSIYKKRKKFSHKGTFGHSLIIGGSYGKIGAVVLASRSALKIGSGLVTAYIPKCGYQVLQSSNPEVMVEVDDEKYLQYFNFKTKPTVIGIGIGMGEHLKTKNGFANFLKDNKLPLVIDADALNILSKHKELLELIPENSILTPHPKEFERLVGKWKNDYEKLNKLQEFSLKYSCIIILKGAYSAIAYQNKIYFNNTGNPALATAGSGDILTGVITGLLAQNYSSLEASVLGVYIHGKAADIAIKTNQTEETFIASDGVSFFNQVFNFINDY
ncbi:MAG: NAD(P)H-hydrate dehydratase [Flavobacteriaceae bacterium]|nr:NAD(P)H-hydrate dehydratase [Flavobacteriaceae bacterium]